MRKSLVIFLSVILLVLVFLFASFWYRQYQSKKIASSSNPLLPSFIADASASENTQVENKVVAEKLNLERKIIAPKSAAQVGQIQSVIEENGGEIIHSKADLIVAFVPKETEEKIKQKFETDKSIEAMEIDYPTFLAADNPDWGVVRIEAPQVWPTTTAEGIKIAVIDTGIDYTHQDLKGRYVGGYDTYNEDSNPFDDHGHGTHVSGIIASELNEIGLAGVAPKASILAVKALDAYGTGYISDVVEAIDWAVANGAQVMNFSLGSYEDSVILRNKITEAASKGIYLIAAAGNTYGGPLLYPAAYGSVISVAATDNSDRLASFSSLGAEIAAPGVNINSSIPGNSYASWSGTSMACPHVTATVALMIANKQTNIRESLHNTAIDLGPAGKDSYFGYGLVHAKPAALGEDKLAPVVTFLSPENNAKVFGQVKVELNVQDENAITEVGLLIDNQLVQKWTQGPYVYLWETSNLEKKDYLLLAQATDNSGNLGSAKVTVTVSSTAPSPTPLPSPSTTPSPLPSLSPSPQASQSPNVSPSPTASAYPERGGSEEHRQDIYGPAEEHRQNYPNWPGQQKPKSETDRLDSAPEVTNLYRRNPKPQKEEKKEEKGKNVKGVYFSPLLWWQRLLEIISSF